MSQEMIALDAFARLGGVLCALLAVVFLIAEVGVFAAQQRRRLYPPRGMAALMVGYCLLPTLALLCASGAGTLAYPVNVVLSGLAIIMVIWELVLLATRLRTILGSSVATTNS